MRTPRRHGLLLAVLAAALGAGLSACNALGPQACTQIGCDSGLLVELQDEPQAPFTVTATAEDGRTRTIDCPDPANCRIFFEGFTPSEVTITYESGGDAVEQTFSPAYTRSRPNGEDCPPECVNATVRLDIVP